MLQTVGLLLCAGEDKEKVKHVLAIVNPEGQAQDSVAANDRQLEALLPNLIMSSVMKL